MSLKYLIVLITFSFLCLSSLNNSYGQEIKWLRVTPLQSPINDIGEIYECELTNELNCNCFTWPAQYGIGTNDQNTLRAEGLWIGCKNFDDPGAGKILNIKVIASGPRNDPDRENEIFPVELKLIGKKVHPTVNVNNVKASLLDTYDLLDSVVADMAPDRMVIVKFNTSIGISVTKKVMSFANSNDGNYLIYDLLFKNTGIYDQQGDVKKQTLDSMYFYFFYRYAFCGESYGSASEPVPNGSWGAFASAWGISTFNHDFGNYGSWSQFNNSSSPLYQMRGYYSYYGPNKARPVTYEEDWGCPAQSWDGRLGSWKYAGNIVLHADKSAADKSDDFAQPQTTWFLASDLDITQTVNQFDETLMSRRYKFMTEGHPPLPHDLTLGPGVYEDDYTDADRNAGGGTSQGQGFGPYTLAPGDSIHIVFATSVSGISREKNLDVGANWLKYYNKTGTPDLIMPDGSAAPKTLDGANQYKKAWVQSGGDSLIQAYREAINNYSSNYQLGNNQTPPPPDQFTVESGGNKISLSWSENADSYPYFNGYVIYRSEGSVMDPLSTYTKIFECDKSNVVHSFDDLTPKRGFDYYYYIQTKSDGSQNKIRPGEPIYSSLIWTITDQPAHLERPAITGAIPFDIATTKWIAITERGAWTPSAMYFYKPDSTYGADAVSFNGATYICNRDSLIGAATPAIADSVWKKVTSRGIWVSGAQYNPFDFVVHDNIEYYTPFSISGGQGLDLVRVVPNPYDIRSRVYQFGLSPQQQDRIAFYGLPPVCKLKIFTERGDIIWSLDHTNGTGDELWNSTTTYGQVVASGVYVLYVETPDGRNVIRKFVIIR
jgi:hypothetical protein